MIVQHHHSRAGWQRYLFLLLLILLTPVARAQEGPPELRGLWVNAWSRGLRSKAEVTNMIAAARKARLNTLFVQVRRRGDALYETDLAPRCPVIPQGFDPLAEVLRQAGAAGLEVHAWLPMMAVWSTQAGKTAPAGHVFRTHPEWITWSKAGRPMRLSDGAEGVYLDPGVPEVQDHLESILLDLARRYPDLDGIHMDYIRYPGASWGYHPVSVKRFKDETALTPTGSPAAFQAWKARQVTDLVTRIKTSLSEKHPGVLLSAAVFANRSDAVTSRSQEWHRWMALGLVDFVCPMNYATKTETFTTHSRSAIRLPGSPAYVGIGSYNKSVAATVAQARLLRNLGAQGMLFYDYAHSPVSLWQNLADKVFHQPAQTPWEGNATAAG